LAFGERDRGFHQMQPGFPTQVPRQVFEHSGGELSFSRADFDQIPAAGFTHRPCRPRGDGPRGGIRKHWRGGEIPGPADPGNPPRIVAGLGIVQGLRHELLEGNGGVNIEH
jgi:hypothetical protein